MIFQFTGCTWQMSLNDLFFQNRPLTLCKRAIKYAFEEPEDNRDQINKFTDYFRDQVEVLKKGEDPASSLYGKYVRMPLNKQYDKFTKLLDYIISLEDKYYA